MTFFSGLDDTEQPYGLYVPNNYDEKKKYPLVIMLHGAGSNHRLALKRVFGKSNTPGETDVEASRYFQDWNDIDYIVASPFARGTTGYQGIPEQDVYDVLADVKRRFNIDEDRTYLTGLSMGGGGTLWIGLTRPDLWAALAPVCPAPPRGTENFLPNGYNLPFHFYHGDADRAVPVSVSREWVKKLTDLGAKVEYDEYPGVEHNSWENAYKDQAIFTWFNQFKRNLYPSRVMFNSSQYKYPKAYWVRFDQLTPGTLASIDADFKAPNQLYITASNLGAFTLTLTGHSNYQKGQPIQVTINGKKIKATSADSISFHNKDGKWISGRQVLSQTDKKSGAEGPISDAFSGRHVYVFGTHGNPTKEEQKRRMDEAVYAANWATYRGAFLGRIMFFPRVISDKEVRPSDLEISNLILFGTSETNSVIEKYAGDLPLHLSGVNKDLSLIYVFPLNGRYVVVNSGLPWWTTTETTQSFFPAQAHSSIPGMKDFLLFKGDAKNIVAEGYFTNQWTLTTEQKKVLSENGVKVK